MKNIIVNKTEIKAIRALDDFDLEMFLSEMHDHGWQCARALLRIMPDVADMFDDNDQIQKERSRFLKEVQKEKSRLQEILTQHEKGKE